jgi:hypothetical protein
MARRSSESRLLLRQLNAELSAASEHAGMELSWTPQETAPLASICDQLDRKTELYAEYRCAGDAEAKTAGGEIRRRSGHTSARLDATSQNFKNETDRRPARTTPERHRA